MRKIIHIDADSFYASVEIRNQPQLADQPVAIGGSPDKRGVVATCNYVARKFGVHSAMSSARALSLCPDLIFLRPNFPLYKSVSAEMHEIFRRYTDQIQPLSLDEAYLDVSGVTLCQGSATLIAESIRSAVHNELKITVSAGVAPNKFLAKVASDWNKPNGLMAIPPDKVAEFVAQLPVHKINGVGKVTAAKMNRNGIYTCQDLQRYTLPELVELFGSHGVSLFDYARGVDNRPVSISRLRKSLSVERTFNQDISDLNVLQTRVEDVFVELTNRYGGLQSRYSVSKRFVKVKFSDFTRTTMEESLSSIDSQSKPEPWQNLEAFKRLARSAVERQTKAVRLIGLGVRLIPVESEAAARQLDLFTNLE
ncbi:DNA polymerase IV [Oleiphilus messinensis]|nr:DNA polymerase IV [Oleiphilus messinensis]